MALYVDNSPYYIQNTDKILSRFEVDPSNGYSNQQVLESQKMYGANEIKKKKRSFYKVIIAPVINLLIIIYLLSAIAMAALGEVQRTTPTFIIVGFNIVVAIIQQFRAEKKLESLQKLSQSTNIVYRNNELVKIPADKIVLGDIILLSRGDKVPADARIIKSSNFLVDESSLTGESELVKKTKTGKALAGNSLVIQDQNNMVFMGTFVASGKAKCIVVKIGNNTEIGKIQHILEQTTTGDIPLRKKMNVFAKYLGWGVLTLLILSIIYKSYILSEMNELTWNNFRLALIDSIDLGMKVMPINLPLLTTIILITGVLTMAKKGVIVRDISSTESLGRVSIVCSDKTGTMTKNEMTVVNIWTPDLEFKVTGSGYSPEGEISIISKTREEISFVHLENLILSSYLNNNSSIVREEYDTYAKENKKIKWSIIGLPTEGALRVLGKKYNPDIDKTEQNFEFIHEFPFDPSLKRMSKIFRYQDNYYLFSKGAPEWLIDYCSSYSSYCNKIPMNDEIKRSILDNVDRYAKEGYRVLGIAYNEIEKSSIFIDLEKEGVREKIENNMVFLGLVVIQDPPREDVYQAISECKDASIGILMITGDNISTGKSIAKQLGIFDDNYNLAVEGKDIENLSDDDFLKVSVFGRVSPEHKQVIVKRYQEMGKVVSMSGDGVNDALALSMADCGLAMGIQGTEVAKEAADMVITDDAFSTIVTGIKEGRSLFEKIRTIIYFFICISVMESIILFSSTLGPDPFFAMYDYWQLNFLYVTAHMFPTFGIILGNIPKDIMKQKPRDSTDIITKRIFKIMFVQMILMGLSIVIVYVLTYQGIISVSLFNKSGIGPGNLLYEITDSHIKARTISLMVLFILISVLMPFQIRRLNKPVTESIKDIKYKEWGFYTTSFIILVVCIYVIPIQEMMNEWLSWPLNLMYLDAIDWLIVIACTFIPFFLFESIRSKMNKKKDI